MIYVLLARALIQEGCMRSSQELRFVIEIEVSDLARFKELVHECVEISREEPGTFVYDWYVDEQGSSARLYEAYESPEALRAHVSGRVFREVGAKLMDVCRFIHLDAFGDFGSQAGGQALWPTTYWGAPIAALSR
jgi:quinol monooxygenase YgiN